MLGDAPPHSRQVRMLLMCLRAAVAYRRFRVYGYSDNARVVS